MPQTLAALIHPLTPEVFRDQYYGEQSLYVAHHEVGRAGQFASLFGWAALSELLNAAPIPHPKLKLVQAGKAVAAQDFASILAAIQAGATLILDQVHRFHPALAEFASALADELGEPVQINLYCSQAEQQGFAKHYDTHDVFILQVEGDKSWRVYEPTLRHPLPHQKHTEQVAPTTPSLEVTLRPGDVLYLPRGHWHDATASGQASLHLTVGVLTRTGTDFLHWLADALRADPCWRKHFPLVFPAERDVKNSLATATTAHAEMLKAALREALEQPALLADYQRHLVAQSRRWRPFDFPAQMLAAPVRALQATRFIRPLHQRAEVRTNAATGFVEVTVWGKLLKFQAAARPLVEFLFSTSHAFSQEELLASAPQLPATAITALLDRLIREGLLQIAPTNES